jgi:hypothetical protein
MKGYFLITFMTLSSLHLNAAHSKFSPSQWSISSVTTVSETQLRIPEKVKDISTSEITIKEHLERKEQIMAKAKEQRSKPG